MNRVPLAGGPPSCPSNETRDDDDAAIGTNDVPYLKELHKHFLATIHSQGCSPVFKAK